MILDPRVLTARAARAGRHSRVEGRRPRVLVALGGGSGVLSAVPALARSLVQACPDMVLEVAAGFCGRARPALTGGRWIDRRGGLLLDLARVDVVVVAGGVTLYEACAVGVPAVAVSIVSAQRHAIEALAARGAVVDAGSVVDAGTAQRVGRSVAALLRVRRGAVSDGRRRKTDVDGRGAFRAAARLRQAMRASLSRSFSAFFAACFRDPLTSSGGDGGGTSHAVSPSCSRLTTSASRQDLHEQRKQGAFGIWHPNTSGSARMRRSLVVAEIGLTERGSIDHGARARGRCGGCRCRGRKSSDRPARPRGGGRCVVTRIRVQSCRIARRTIWTGPHRQRLPRTPARAVSLSLRRRRRSTRSMSWKAAAWMPTRSPAGI